MSDSADANLALSTIIEFPPITPGLGGWDARLSEYIDDMRIPFHFGLLGRQVNLSPDTAAAGSILITVPTGFSAMPTFVHVIRRGTTPDVTNSYDFGSEDTNPTNWNDGVANFNRLDDNKKRLIIVPRVAGVNLAGDSPIAPMSINGADTNNDFRVIRTAGVGLALDWWVFGYCWRNP